MLQENEAHQKQAPSQPQSRAVRHPVTQPSGPILTIWSPAGCQYSHSSSPGCARRTRVGSPQLRFTSAAFIPTRMVFWIMAWRNSLLVKERHSAATNVGIPANTNATATAYSLRLCMVVPPEQCWWANDTAVGGCRAKGSCHKQDCSCGKQIPLCRF